MRHFTEYLLVLCLGLVLLPAQVSNGYEESARSKKTVWSGSWWPLHQGGITGPLSKYDQLYGKRAVQWELEHNASGPNVPKWSGFCHAWSASAVLEEEPTKILRTGNLTLTIGDQKGLWAAGHAEDEADFFGRRYGPGEDLSDIEPTAFWEALKTHIMDLGMPIVVDIEPTEAVWNYPIYSYRVSWAPHGNQGIGTIEILFADDSVPRDFVGLKAMSKRYTFVMDLDSSGLPIKGSGKWTGNSIKDHPDFLWFPKKAKPENDEVEYTLVRKMLHCAPLTEPEIPSEPRPQPQTEIPSITPPELVKLIADQTSDFMLDITVDKFDGGIYSAGERITISGKSEKSGFLYLIGISPQGALTVVYPQNGDNNRIQAGSEFMVPGPNARYSFTIQSQPGLYRIKALVTDKPLVIGGWDPEASEPVLTSSGSQALDYSNFRWSPSTAAVTSNDVRDIWNNRTGREGETVKKRFNLERFAQDEVAFVVKKPH